ncbi:hypothetical protein R1flu_023388 [Riccia fluitans]|uniref:Secreted protein n=1 Tax=Riccia fluitans TaxID=41844 RepID=A0ABD1XUX8_9MARC
MYLLFFRILGLGAQIMADVSLSEEARVAPWKGCDGLVMFQRDLAGLRSVGAGLLILTRFTLSRLTAVSRQPRSTRIICKAVSPYHWEDKVE